MLLFEIRDCGGVGDELVEGSFVEGDYLVCFDVDVDLGEVGFEETDDVLGDHLVAQHGVVLVDELLEPQVED